MPTDILDYRSLVEKPWGRMFYDQIYTQLDIEEKQGLKILDFGSGFGVSAAHFSQKHQVTAVEPNGEMLALRFPGAYRQLQGGLEILGDLGGGFDMVLCHNVLEYLPEKPPVIAALAGALKPGGKLSVIKHNLPGRVVASAIFDNQPEKALALLSDAGSDQSSTFGERFLYDEEALSGWSRAAGLSPFKDYGMRSFFALSRDNDSKFDPQWYRDMLALETCASTMPVFRDMAFFRHYIYLK